VSHSEFAFVFPGQGAQKPGMGREVAERYPEAARIFREADEILGFPVSRLCFEGPADELVRTENTQPALFTTSVAVLRAVSNHMAPAAVAGHSVGEYAALVAAGAVSFEDALPVVRLRGELMADAVENTPGGMAALMGASEAMAGEICRDASTAGLVEPSNLNSPTQIVVSGESPAVARAVEVAKSRGVRAVRLNVGAPFHCSLMKPVQSGLEPALNALPIHTPDVPVVANATGDYVQSAEEIRAALLSQVVKPVLWTASIERMNAEGLHRFVEIGPGRVLSGLVASIDPGAETVAVGTPDDVEKLALQAG